MNRVATVELTSAEHVFALRQRGRIAADAIGCDEADRVRFATALSELGRETLAHGGGARAHFGLENDGTLAVAFEDFPRSALLGKSLTGIDAARRLVGDVTVADGPDERTAIVTLRRPRDPGREPTDPTNLSEKLSLAIAVVPIDEIGVETRELVATLEALKGNEEQLRRLNDELEETNRGVMAMYAQLADELDETNRGVVALYAELDEKNVSLKEASDAKSRFLASVSHELRSPVSSVLGLVDLLLDPHDTQSTTDQKRQLDLIQTSAGELLRLVNDLLDLAKAESGHLQPDITRVDLEEVFSELRGSLRPLMAPGVALEIDVPEIREIESDRLMLVRVIRNLLTNAAKFTKSGRVHLCARALAPFELRISVSDTGIGIAREDRSRVFEEFYQVRGPLQAAHKGTGLGLPFVRRVTEALGGRVDLTSEVGVGTTFTLDLPTVWQPLLEAPLSPESPDAHHRRDATVVIVDDDDAFRAVLRGFLQGLVGQVLEARGGVAGIDLVRTVRPDLVFVDLHMPDLDGASVLAELGIDPLLRDIPVAIVTSSFLDMGTRDGIARAFALLAKSNVSRESIARVVSASLVARASRA